LFVSIKQAAIGKPVLNRRGNIERQSLYGRISEPRLLPDLEVIVDGANDVFNELLSAAKEKDKQVNH
jgi:hypothetical protein